MRIVWSIVVILSMCSAGAAQSTTTVQTGFVVITPASQTFGNLLVSETLVSRNGEETFQGSIEATPLFTNVMFVLETAPPLRDTGFSVVNPNNSAATLTIVLRNLAGNVTVCKSVVIPPRRQLSRFVSEVFKDQGVVLGTTTGLLSVSSTLAVGVIGLQFNGTAFSTVPMVNRPISTTLTPESCSGAPGGGPVFSASPVAETRFPLLSEGGGLFPVPTYAAGVGGPGAILLPQFVTGGAWKSEIVVANVSTVPQVIRVDFFSSAGVPLAAAISNNVVSASFTNVSLPPGGAVAISSID